MYVKIRNKKFINVTQKAIRFELDLLYNEIKFNILLIFNE